MDPTSATIEIHVCMYIYTYIVWICMIYLYIVSTSMKIQVPTNHSWDPRLPSPRSRPNPGISRFRGLQPSQNISRNHLPNKKQALQHYGSMRVVLKNTTFRLVRIPFEAINTLQIFEDWSLWPPSAQEFHQTCGFEHRVSPKLLYTSSWLCLTKKAP